MKHLVDNSLLDNELAIYQKVDGCSIFVEKKNNKLYFYNRDKRQKIDIIMRTYMDIYEDAIEFFENNINKIPNDIVLQFEYFPSNIDPIIPMELFPWNNLVLLTDIEINLDVEKTPVIFKGKLNNHQKEYLINRELSPNILKELFDYDCLINKNILEGIVLKINNDFYKIVNAEYTKIIKSKKSFKKDMSYDIELINFIINDFNLIIPNDYYFTSRNFLRLIEYNLINNHEKILEVNYKFEKYNNSQNNMFKLNTKFISNDLINILDSNWKIDLFRFCLIHLSREKKRTTKLIDKSMKELLNKKMNYTLRRNTNGF